MSALHRLKAYFGMVPADELDDDCGDYGDYGEYGDYDDAGAHHRGYGSERPLSRRPPSRRPAFDDYAAYPEPEPAVSRVPRRTAWSPDATPVRGALAVDTAPPLREPVPRTSPFAEDDAHPLARIITLHPRTYNEARPIGERYREGTPVIMNLTEMDDADAKRLVDFAAGLAFALRGSIDKVTTKVFLLSPANVAVSAEDKRRIAEGGFFNQS